MSLRRRILKLFYPLLTLSSRLSYRSRENHLPNSDTGNPESFFSLSAQLNNGSDFYFSSLRGKKVLIVNTASDCGYTAQYGSLQKLYKQQENLEILAFPSNDFKNQESGSDEDIAGFCSLNYGITFPLFKKISVKHGQEQHPVYKWLTTKDLNGWNDKEPQWNFHKYLVDEYGYLLESWEAGVDPMNSEFQKRLNAKQGTSHGS